MKLTPKRVGTKVTTGRVRFSYAHVFEPKAIGEGQAAKYSVSLLIPKTDTETIKLIEEAIAEAAETGKAKLGGKIPANLKTPLRDGDLDREDDAAYAGCMFINANSSNKPGVVDANVAPILDREEFYSGAFGRASVTFYAYSANGNKGIACGLQNIQKTEDGERLSGGASAESDFGDHDDLG